MPWHPANSPVEVGSQLRVGSFIPIIYRGSEPSNSMACAFEPVGRLKNCPKFLKTSESVPKGGNPQLPTSSKRAREAGPISPSGLAWASQEIEGIGTQNVGFHLVILRLQYSKCWTWITLRGIELDFGFNLTPSFGQLLRRPVLHSLLHYLMGLAPSQHRAVQQIDIHRLEMQCTSKTLQGYWMSQWKSKKATSADFQGKKKLRGSVSNARHTI